MGLVNKEIDAAVKTSSAVTKAGMTTVKTATKSGANLLVNRTADIYDQHENLTDGLGNSMIGHSAMAFRSGYRVTRSLGRSGTNIYKRNKFRIKYAKKKAKEAEENFISEHGEEEWNSLSDHEKNKIKETANDWKDKRRSEKWKMYNSEGIRKGAGISSTKQSLAKSTKEMISNQTRKGLSTIANKEDIGSKTIGTTARGTRLVWKNRKRVAQTARKTMAVMRTIVSSVVTFVTSIPTMIASLAASLPAIIIIIVVIVIASVFGEDLEFSGRVSLLTEGEIRLENDYQTSINPEEILAITSVLGWTTPKFEDYERLMGIANEGERGEVVGFETMMDNVFRKHNPATILNPNKPIDEWASTGITYYTSEDWKNGVLKKSLSNNDWLQVYPQYKKASIAEKKKMGSSAYVEEMKSKCREALELNGYNYLASFLTIDNPPGIFTSYVLPPDSNAKVSSPTGYRAITLLDKNGNEYLDTRFHYGTDIAASGGTPVYAPTDMTVVYADGSQTVEGSEVGLWGAGNVVVLKKEMYDRLGKRCYLYIGLFHMQYGSVTVKAGQKIKSGKQVGKVGTTGTSTGNHLHFQTWISVNNYKGTPLWVNVNPNNYSDDKKGALYSIDDHDYDAIYLEGLSFYDVAYRNKLFR